MGHFYTQYLRFYDATGYGPLNGPNDAEPRARRIYQSRYFDPIGRGIAQVSVGTNGGALYTRPDNVPERSNLVIVSSTRYGKNGEAVAAIDPNGIETRWVNDNVGRRIRLLEGIDPCNQAQSTTNNAQIPDPCHDAPRITEFAYNADGQMIRLTLFNDETGNQKT